MNNLFLKTLIILFLCINTNLYSQVIKPDSKNNEPIGKQGEIGAIVNLNPLSLNENQQVRLNYLIDYKNDTLYTWALSSYNTTINKISPGVILQFNSDTLSLGKIKNHIKVAYNNESKTPVLPIVFGNSTMIFLKMKKELVLSILNNAGITPTSVYLSGKELNKLFGEKFLMEK